MQLDEPAARSLLLVQAIEAADEHHRVLGLVERERIEEDAWAAAPQPQAFLQERARRILAAVAQRDARVCALANVPTVPPWLAWALPPVAFVLGIALDSIDNPRQVNMLSPPLLLFLAWNLAMYVALVVAHRAPGIAGRWLPRWPDRAGGDGLRTSIAAEFRERWWRVGGALESWRLQRVLHASAAAWAVGVGVSIVMGGLVREYRVGWESTLLDAPQVHAFLRALFAPVVVLTPLEGFSMVDVERMHFRSGVQVARAEARHWVVLYVGLLAVVVIVPRLVLAWHARWRAQRSARELSVDLAGPYFTTVLARIGVRMLARFLVEAARDSEEVRSAPFSIKRLVSATERDASLLAREEAMAVLLQRVDARLQATMEEIAKLHGRTSVASAFASQSRDFILNEPVDAPQAGVAGAAAGVAAGALAGAKIDLLTGGLTMGAATLLGALIGGTGALTAARWMNRTTSDGKTVVQLGDEMLGALAADVLVRHAAITGATEPTPAAVQALMASDAQRYPAFWARARSREPGAEAELVDCMQSDLDALRSAR